MKRKNQKNRKLIGGIVVATAGIAVVALLKSRGRYSLENKVVLITGGTRGLGLILARRCVSEGAKVAVCARDPGELDHVSKELAPQANAFLAVRCDISDKDQVNRMASEVEERLGPVDALINNAGIMEVGPAGAMGEEDYQDAMNVNFWGPFYVFNRALPGMKDRGGGRVVNIVSIGGRISAPHLLPYNVSKFALSGFSEGIAAEMAKNNIRITTVYPGLMRTGSPRNVDVRGRHEQEYAWFKIADFMPLVSMSADKAAKKILKAMKSGDKTLTLTFTARFGNLARAVAPGFVIRFFDLINRLLPGGGPTPRKKGFQSETKATDKKPARKVEARYNQIQNDANK